MPMVPICFNSTTNSKFPHCCLSLSSPDPLSSLLAIATSKAAGQFFIDPHHQQIHRFTAITSGAFFSKPRPPLLSSQIHTKPISSSQIHTRNTTNQSNPEPLSSPLSRLPPLRAHARLHHKSAILFSPDVLYQICSCRSYLPLLWQTPSAPLYRRPSSSLPAAQGFALHGSISLTTTSSPLPPSPSIAGGSSSRHSTTARRPPPADRPLHHLELSSAPPPLFLQCRPHGRSCHKLLQFPLLGSSTAPAFSGSGRPHLRAAARFASLGLSSCRPSSPQQQQPEASLASPASKISSLTILATSS